MGANFQRGVIGLAYTCETCLFWSTYHDHDRWGYCSSEKFVDVSEFSFKNEIDLPQDSLLVYDAEQYSAWFRTGRDFGCVHHQEREEA